MPSYGDTRDWKHKEMILPVGAGKFIFRTLSLYEADAVWPLARPMIQSLQTGKPAQWGECLVALMEVLCPELLRSPEFQHFGGPQMDALVEFYQTQDWGRLTQLGQALDEGSESSGEATDPRAAFVALCVAGAKFANMTVVEFADSRFEFCADVFVSMARAIRKEKGEGDGKSVTLEELRLNLEEAIEGAGQVVTPATAPVWLLGVISNAQKGGDDA